MTPEELEIFEKKLYDALIVWKATNEFTDNLYELFMELIDRVFEHWKLKHLSEEHLKDCKSYACLKCYEYVKKFDPDKINERTGEKTNPRIYFTVIIRSAFAHDYCEAVKHKKMHQNESQGIKR